MEVIERLNGVFWGWLVAGILLLFGIYITVRLRFVQFRYFSKLLSNLRAENSEGGGVSGFGALCGAVGAEVGTGSLVGVATALASGGPGAVFWMWVTSILGMPIIFSEAVLGQVFRVKNDDGTYKGGPAYYIEQGMSSRLLATLFSVSLILGIGCIYVMIQSNSIASAVNGVSGISPWIAGMALMVLVAAVIFGGIRRLSEVASKIVPFMAFVYLALSIFAIFTHLAFFGEVLKLIFTSAFGFRQIGGGIAGFTVQQAFRYGVARGLFSNDAGNGTTPSMHAAANVRHPVNQGINGMLGCFTTTIIVCSCTAFCILLSGKLGDGSTGIVLTQEAFSVSFGPFGRWIIFFAMFLFGYTTLLADIYYGEVNLTWLFPGGGEKLITGWRVFSCLLVLLGSAMDVSKLWELADFTTAFMVFFNIIALVVLSRYVVFVLRDFERKKQTESCPAWDYDNSVLIQYKEAGGLKKTGPDGKP